jgi:hypothetical protein
MSEPTQDDIERTRQETLAHIVQVRESLFEITSNLHRRAFVHDASKLQEPELSGFAQMHLSPAASAYGTPAYDTMLAEAQETVAHHYAHNSHHPQFYENGIAGMSLLDIVEMFADWRAASTRTPGGSLAQSLAVNRERFGTDPILSAIFENTRRELGWD